MLSIVKTNDNELLRTYLACFSHLFPVIVPGSSCYFESHFVDEETEAERI